MRLPDRLVAAYGAAVYALFLATFLYTIGFVAGFGVPKTLDDGAPGSPVLAIVVDGALLLLFAVQHTIMARPRFKRWWTRIVPAAAERSTFVLITCTILVTTFVLWRPLPGLVWSVESPALRATLHGIAAAGWAMVLVSTFLIDHFALFGLRQSLGPVLGLTDAPRRFQVRGFYAHVRHPLMTGFMIAFWATPDMSVGHLLFAGLTLAYVLFGVRVEERDLVAAHGDDYLEYRRAVPMLLPRLRPARRVGQAG